MRFYGSIEDANKAAQTRANAYRNAAGYINTVAKVVKQFDGKVYNCRLDKALKEATEGRVFCNKNQYLFEIYTYPESHYSFHIGLANIKAEDLTEGKRIPADKIIKSLQEHREMLLRKAYDIESHIGEMEQVRAYIMQTKEKLENYCRSFNTDLRDIYRIPYCVRID
ncbi:hypothetical protein [Butyrivibrio sp. AE2032]|uniref:hypothetical protein n=1 Tax=Butyrivibrio sp. AE2032 TaxID=1458463 RepID=UPI0005540DA6|nr:hypothetical protein [Butyrivibrio sp. AE2032]